MIERIKQQLTNPSKKKALEADISYYSTQLNDLKLSNEEFKSGEAISETITSNNLVENVNIYPYHQAKNIIEREISQSSESSIFENINPINFSIEKNESKIEFEIPESTNMHKFMALTAKSLGNVELSSYGSMMLSLVTKDSFRINITQIMPNEPFTIAFTSNRELKSQEIETVIKLYKQANLTNESLGKPRVVLESLGATIFDSKNAPTWDHIAGYEKVKKQVIDSVIFPFKHPEVYEEVARKTRKNHESIRPKAVLFEGPPGTGKTTMARLIAGQVDATLVYVPIESIMSKWYGQSERNLADIFNTCKRLENTLLFLDEIDSLATTRDGDIHEATRRVLSVLLRKIDGFNPNDNTILIGATNRKKDLDPALLSRFNTSIEFPLPNLLERQAIFKNYAKHLSDEELKTLSQKGEGLSGRDIKNFCERVERTFVSDMISNEQEIGDGPSLNNYLSELK